ncbi:hypothetical protein [Brevibacillus reuszeri]|uniref:hypothetical protein n=1 Tax=Brevibacillus reuszeri TaxID=54915 RepID=UPI002896713D|nr:hypothetical protein [Brevibacillus reuszeri]
MSEDRVWKEWSQSAKQAVKEQYPFQLQPLETEVLKKIQSQNWRRPWRIAAWTAGVAVSATFFLQVVQPYHRAEDLFGLTGARQYPAQFEWSIPDQGFSQARDHGYPILPEIKVEKDGFTFQLKDLMVDQRRITYTLLVSGEKLEEIVRDNDEDKKFALLYGGLMVNLGEMSLRGGASTDLQPIKGTNYFVIKANYLLESQKMRELMNQPNPVLPVVIERQNKDSNEVLAEIRVPLPKAVLAAEKVIEPIQGSHAEMGADKLVDTLSVNQIVAAPTIMQVELEAKLNNGFELKRLQNARLVDEKGKEYSAVDDTVNPNVERILGTDKYTLKFIPSLYFADLPEGLELRFSGIVANREMGESLVLDRNAKYPQDIPFGKQTLRIQRVYYKDDHLFIVIPNKEPEEITLRIDNQIYKDFIIADSLETVTFSFPVKKKDSYELWLSGFEREESTFEGVIPITPKK